MRRLLWLLVACLAAASCGGDGGSVFSTGPTAATSTSEPVDELVDEGSGIPLSEVLPPEASTIISTAGWGEVYDRRIVVRLADDAGPGAADEVAAAVGGTVVARVEDFLITEIELADSGEEALAAALTTLEGRTDVAIAAPSGVYALGWEATPMPCGPLDSLVLQGNDLGDQYSLIGVEDAWRLVRAAGLPLAKPSIGVVDGFGSQIGYHGSWVNNTVASLNAPGNPPGVFDAILGDGAATFPTLDVFGASSSTSITAYLKAIETLADPPHNAKVINVSLWHPSNRVTPQERAQVQQALRDLAVRHPDVVVVTIAGNGAADVANNLPGGLSEPNLITVGGVNHQGERWLETWTDAAGVQQTSGSNYVGTGGEITLNAIAQDVFTGMNTNGDPAVQSGTSFAAPQVAAAAAVLQALDPTLSAAQVKQILVDSAATEIANPDINQRITAVDPALGGRVLRIDNAVYKLMSERLGVTAPRDQLIAKGTLNVRARPEENDPLTYVIRAIAPGGGDGVTVEITSITNSAGALLPGQPSMTTDDDVARWRWMFSNYGETAQVTLTRTDTGACGRLTLTATEPTFLYAGTYEGSFVLLRLQAGETSWAPVTRFTLKVENDRQAVGEGGVVDSITGPNGSFDLDLSFTCEGAVGDAGALVCAGTWSAENCIAYADGTGECEQGSGPITLTMAIDTGGVITGAATGDVLGAEEPIEGHAVSGGPAGLP